MSVASFIPKIWNSAIKEPYAKALVFGQPSVASDAYIGAITKVGDTVKINAIGSPTISPYVRGEKLTYEELNTTATEIKIDQADRFGFLVNDVDEVQVAGDIQGPATRNAGIGLRDGADKYLANVLKDGALAANKLGTVQVVNDRPELAGDGQTTMYKILVQLSEKLNAQSVPVDGRYVVIGAKSLSALLMDERFTRVDGSGTDESLRNGIVGRAVGFDVLTSNNLPSTAGRELVIAGVPDAFSYADQLVNTEALRSQDDFADIIRGLHVYGAAVNTPAGIATADVNVADPVVAPAGA